ncbi:MULTISPECIES: cell division protein FtsP [Lonsdalea]|uniref:Cell division protein FtsI n=4 Tax=Lonsdalea TaxID=1082702 RepID=A0ACD1JI08_9GAMM|nr:MULTISPECIES: cell division protein FtsP [Lonsdalea]OSN01832.1 cell division protein FtsI [Lonsdalea populi]QPQ23935.1 cell division protein FtsP [Lonsdalea populi]RAT16685.1 cell division protein FtsI [Lonsdalea quercina]RAT16856.1 cell division protein FtsI [Lonsdalea quercina]RAT22710.1 cell division protein FtsI [Lonsdalea populi]
MSLSRRQFLRASGVALCSSAIPLTAKADVSTNMLPIPPLIESRRGQPVFLTLQRAHWVFSGNRKVAVWGINGRYLGPTVRVYSDDDVKLIYSNRLSEPVSMTVSGLQVPGSLMGGAGRIIPAGMDWSPVLPIRQPAATCWYHANTPNRMAPHVYNGLAGLWLVEDRISQSLPIPNHYGVDDFPLIIQDKRLDGFGTPQYDPPSHGGFVGDILLVNGMQTPFVEVSRGWVRLRLLNASNARRYVLKMSDGRPMHLIANDQGFLPAPLALNLLPIAPGERREILIDMSKGDQVTLTAGESAGIMDRLRGLFEPSSILVSGQILTLKPTGMLPLVTDTLPMRLMADNIVDSTISRTREFRLGDTLPGINGAMWDMNRTDVQTQAGRCERWLVHADTAQPFHIQGASFLVRSVNGGRIPPEDNGWKDTVWVENDVELLVYFNQPSVDLFPFLYYSHTLEMADKGSAGQLVVQANA